MAARIRFGTDGIRGTAGQFPLDEATAARVGLVLGRGGRRVVVARDTRTSGPALARGLLAGVASAGGTPVDAGVLPTPGLSVLLSAGWGAVGVMVTASHNPPEDNGLKVLGPDGRKLPDPDQEALEQALEQLLDEDLPLLPRVSVPERQAEARVAYLRHLGVVAGVQLPAGTRIAVDGAEGAASATLPAALAAAGAEVESFHCDADGSRINTGCGSLHPEDLARRVVAAGLHAGVAVDGDGDRAVLVSASGRVLDGDALLYLLARSPAVVGTIMSGQGLEASLRERGIGLRRTPVGDRFVEAAREAEDLYVGAEPSGHACFADGLPTADGTLTALRVLAGGLDLDARLARYVAFPRAQRAVRVAARRDLEGWPEVREARERAAAAVAPGGRVLIRYSGTEPVLRILVEGQQPEVVTAAADDLARTLARLAGTGS